MGKRGEKRGLPNIASSAEALKAFISPDTVELFKKHNVFSSVELQSRYTVWLEMYEKIVEIEARTLLEMVNTLVLPPAYKYQADMADGLNLLKDLSDSGSVKFVDGALDDRKEALAKLTADIYYIRKNIRDLKDSGKDQFHGSDSVRLLLSELNTHMEQSCAC
jgi:glutamine synthetase